MNLSGFDLNLLKVLDALLQEKTTVRAGERLGLSQPAVSAALRRLRLSLGDELFFRHGQKLEPTVFAKSLEDPLRNHLEQLSVLLRGPDPFDPAKSTARFRISGSDFFAELLMPDLAARLSERAPGMKIHLVDLVPDNHVDTLVDYRVDLALVPALPLPDWVQSRPMFRSSFAVIARKDHPRLQRAGLEPGDKIPIDLFCDLGHVLFSPEGNSRAMADDALATVGRERRVVMTLPVFSGVYRAVAGSDLIALLPTQLAHHVAPATGLNVYQPPMQVEPAEIIMIWNRRSTADPAHAWLREEIAGLVEPLDVTGGD
ncbi:LysR family transcriptional regulator [Roseibium sp.]|uniref:LysR family transcriptional regulator n=1 Tax=Roseibium sp. TaxID=1936156 RepID=UPI003D0AADEF